MSGIEEYTRNLLKTLLAIDRENDYSLFYNGLRNKRLNFEAKIINWKIPNKILDFSSRFLKFPAIDNFIKPDLVFSPHFNILETRKAPRVITFHDLSFLHRPDFFSWRHQFWHWLQNVKRQARRAEKIIAVSEFTKNDLVNLLNIPPEKISVIYSGISDEFRPLQIKERQNAVPYILYLGTLEPRKNVNSIIRAFNILKQDSRFKEWQLIIAGKPGWLYKNILNEAKKSPYCSQIIFKGYVIPQEKVLLYNLAKVFVYPSFFEGFGFPPLEAQACGCPVIVSDRTSLPEVMGQSAIFINPWKVEELAEAVKKLAFNKQARERLIELGHENAERFTWHKTGTEVLKLLQHVGQ